MNRLLPLFLQVNEVLEPISTQGPDKGFTLSMRDTLLVITVVFILSMLVFLLVYFTRGRKRSHGSGHSRAIYRAERVHEPDGHEGKHRHKRRRHSHPDNLPRRPTLAEAGGLPPVRQDDPPATASST